MGSLIALLVAAQVLGNNSALTSGYRRQVVLAALAGETWDYMGSRRLLWEMTNEQNSTEGLQLEQISQVSAVPAWSAGSWGAVIFRINLKSRDRSPCLLKGCMALKNQG